MVKKRTLLLLASLVWFAAGFNIARIGVVAYSGYGSLIHALELWWCSPSSGACSLNWLANTPDVFMSL